MGLFLVDRNGMRVTLPILLRAFQIRWLNGKPREPNFAQRESRNTKKAQIGRSENCM
jgi:hypothetical protein